MGVIKWINDLNALAAERRRTGRSWSSHSRHVRAGASAMQEAARRTSFAARCVQFGVFAKNLPEGDDTDTTLLGLSGLGPVTQVRDLGADAKEIVQRLRSVEPQARRNVLTEYGITAAASVNVERLAQQAEVITQMGSTRIHPSWTNDARRGWALAADEAVREFMQIASHSA